jgi:hypothetical protein
LTTDLISNLYRSSTTSSDMAELTDDKEGDVDPLNSLSKFTLFETKRYVLDVHEFRG